MGWVKLNKDQKSDFGILNLGCAKLCCVFNFPVSNCPFLDYGLDPRYLTD